MISLSDKTVPAILEDELQSSYLAYSMSVIVSRALPDVRDGLKPVHRRILYGMHDLGMQPNKPYKKSARIVGDVLGKYHPHGDSAVYDAMVRMAQEWSLRYPLVDGQGNFGSIDGDSPAAMRYTETRLDWLATEMLKDIDKNTVDFIPNFDESLEEPTVLPSVLPNLLINGASGIAVGMATNIPPHNLTEIINGLLAMINNENLTLDELSQIVTGPDFPTGGEIHGYAGIKDAYRDGRGKLIVRAVAKSDKAKSGKTAIIITELPYQVNKASLIEKIAELVRQKTLEDISDIRDESDRDGIRVVIELKRDAIAEVVLNNLYKHTQMQVTFGCNMLALVNGMPRTLGLLDMMKYFIEHRNVVIVRRSKYELDIAEKRAHILEGFLKALNHLDEVIKTIKESRDPKVASTNLQARFELSEEQAKAILDMRLHRLTGLEREKIHQEYKDILQTIERLNIILASKTEQMRIISDELTEIRNKFGDARRTKILPEAKEIRLEDMIADEDVIITITHKGFIKRTPVSSYRNQNKGGRGSMGVGTYEDDFVEHVFRASTHHFLMFFTDKGSCYKVKVYDLPEGSRTAKGRSLANVIQKTTEENVTTYLPVKDFYEKYYIVMATRNGVIKKCELSDFANIRTTGIRAINLADNDELVRAKLTDGNCEILIGTRNGLACRFHEDDVRAMGRAAAGVRSISLRGDDYVVSMVSVLHIDTSIIVIGEKGLGKRTAFKDFRLTRRGAKGVISMNITERTGKVVRLLSASDNEDLVVITSRGVLIRQPVKDIRVIGRNTQGVRLIRLDESDSIADITLVLRDENGNGNDDGEDVILDNAEIENENQEKIDFSEADENSEN